MWQEIGRSWYTSEIGRIVDQLIRRYWVGYPAYIIDGYIQRHIFETILVIHALGGIKEKVVVDVGGGWGAFAATCASIGMKSILIDDFGDPGMGNHNDPRQSLPKDYGVEIMERDVIKDGLGLPPGSCDAITSFDMIEHLHASPRHLLRDSMIALRQNGVLLLGVPNCVNLRKRISVPLGRCQWSDFSDWYESTAFRGHVREPDVKDLKRIAEDIGLCDYQILGRNWLGYQNPNGVVRNICRVIDRVLRLWPSLCSDLYLLGRKR